MSKHGDQPGHIPEIAGGELTLLFMGDKPENRTEGAAQPWEQWEHGDQGSLRRLQKSRADVVQQGQRGSGWIPL